MQRILQRGFRIRTRKKSFLNPNTAQFIVVFNNVWPAASWRSCPRCIYFLSDAPPNNPVIPCGPTTQTAAMRPPSPAPPGPLPRPPRRHSKTHLPALPRPRRPSLSPAAAPLPPPPLITTDFILFSPPFFSLTAPTCCPRPPLC